MLRYCLFLSFSMLHFLPATFAQQGAAAPTRWSGISYDTFFQPLRWRSIGPFRGGRAVAVAGVPDQVGTYYMGTTGGGVWKTEDMGVTWSNITDGFVGTGSVGAIAVAPSHPNTVYVGMGEHPVRGVMTHHGDGMYRSRDGGMTWRPIGLKNTQHIARIRIDPNNPDRVFVAAQGPLYGPSEDRGIFRSTDGGETWKKVLYVDQQTGGVELSMDPHDPDVLYAALWEHGRRPWKVISGGPGSGLYKSTDGGDSWTPIRQGLPAELGKMAVAVCPSRPDRVYALVESDSDRELGGLFVSTDAGGHWTRVSADHRLVQRAWYYTEVFVDPTDESTVYVLSAAALRSADGGRSWEVVEGPHGDYHDLWIHPHNPRNMAIADDGGVGITLNGGQTWSGQDNMPTAQLYRLNVDNGFPYRIYAGQQDNTSLAIASQEFGSSGITPRSWTASAGGESAFLAFDPDNPRLVMGGSYLGTIEIFDMESRAGTNIMAAPIQYLSRDARDMRYRYNWNAPIVWSRHEPDTYYHGAQYLLRTRDKGLTWEEISPDLTRNEKEKQGKGGGPYTNEAVGAENYGTLSYVSESPHEKGLIWTGSDDGLVHLTRDGGRTWRNVTPPGLPECLINAIEVSPHDPATVYIATTRYKFNDHTPGLYKSTDYGNTWTAINQGIPAGAFTRVVREDHERKDLLFAGTETGILISWDGGTRWYPFQLNLPVTPITDLRIHQDDLIAATSGRSCWILDDLPLLRQYHPDSKGFTLFRPQETRLLTGRSELDGNTEQFSGAHPTRGVNPPTGAVLYYHLPEQLADKQPLTLTITDARNKVVRVFSSIPDTAFLAYDGGPPAPPTLSKRPGLNRFVWDLRHTTLPGVPHVYIEGSYRGHKVSPGTYTATLRTDSMSRTTTVLVLPNPQYEVDDASYQAYDSFMDTLEHTLTRLHLSVQTMDERRKRLEDLLPLLPDSAAALRKDAVRLLDRMREWDQAMVQRKSKAYDDVENFPNKFTAEYLFLLNQTESDIPRVNQGSRQQFEALQPVALSFESQARQILSSDIPRLNRALWDIGIGAIW